MRNDDILYCISSPVMRSNAMGSTSENWKVKSLNMARGIVLAKRFLKVAWVVDGYDLTSKENWSFLTRYLSRWVLSFPNTNPALSPDSVVRNVMALSMQRISTVPYSLFCARQPHFRFTAVKAMSSPAEHLSIASSTISSAISLGRVSVPESK